MDIYELAMAIMKQRAGHQIAVSSVVQSKWIHFNMLDARPQRADRKYDLNVSLIAYPLVQGGPHIGIEAVFGRTVNWKHRGNANDLSKTWKAEYTLDVTTADAIIGDFYNFLTHEIVPRDAVLYYGSNLLLDVKELAAKK